jgi:hypothetical protein
VTRNDDDDNNNNNNNNMVGFTTGSRAEVPGKKENL